MRLIVTLTILFGLLAWGTPALAQQADAKAFSSIFDQRNAAVRSGSMDEVLKFITTHTRNEIVEHTKSPAEKKEILDFWKQTIPDPYTVSGVQVSPDGAKAILFVAGNVTGEGGKKEAMEQTVNFVKEGGQWKIDFVTFGGPPAKVKQVTDTAFEPVTNYNTGKTTNLGGRILKTEFLPTYTLVTLRVIDEEDLVYLPPKAELDKKKIKAADLEVGKAYSFDAYPHKTNPLKYWGTGGQAESYFNN